MTTNNSHEQAVQEIPQHGSFGHPRGLGVLFVEFWERFSYYGMRAMLIFYMYLRYKIMDLESIKLRQCLSCLYTGL